MNCKGQLGVQKNASEKHRKRWKSALPLVFLLFLGVLFLGGCGGGSIPTVTETSPPKIDIIGYYGNSGSVAESIPLIKDIPDEYNVLIITFASFPTAEDPIEFNIIGPYYGDYVFPQKPDQLIQDLALWKGRSDPYGRQRKVLVSIGGENGSFPSQGDPEVIKEKLVEFIEAYDLDGLDIDLEGKAVAGAGLLVEVIKALRGSGYLVTAAPEAAQTPLNAYESILPLLDWVHPQFYNNGPNAVTVPWIPGGDCRFWEATDWQASQCDDITNWVLVLQTMQSYLEMSQGQMGMLFPATPQAAGSYNNWDVTLLAEQVKKYGIQHVGTWDVTYDKIAGYAFAKAVAALMEQ